MRLLGSVQTQRELRPPRPLRSGAVARRRAGCCVAGRAWLRALPSALFGGARPALLLPKRPRRPTRRSNPVATAMTTSLPMRRRTTAAAAKRRAVKKTTEAQKVAMSFMKRFRRRLWRHYRLLLRLRLLLKLRLLRLLPARRRRRRLTPPRVLHST